MVQALRSYIGSIRDIQSFNWMLYSIPVVNIFWRRIQEQECFQAAQANPANVTNLKAQQGVFQNDFKAGLVMQAMLAHIAFGKCTYLQPRWAPLTVFVILSINITISLPYHFYAHRVIS